MQQPLLLFGQVYRYPRHTVHPAIAVLAGIAEHLAEQDFPRHKVQLPGALHAPALQNLRAALRLCEQEEWSVRTVPDVWFLPHTLNGEFVPDERIYDQLPGWLDWMPLVTSAQILRMTPEGKLDVEWGLGLEQTEAEQIGFAPKEPAQLLHQGRVLEIYCSYMVQRWIWACCGALRIPSTSVGKIHADAGHAGFHHALQGLQLPTGRADGSIKIQNLFPPSIFGRPMSATH